MSETYRKAAGDKAHANSFERSYIDQKGRKKDCEEYLSSGTWPAAWPEPKLIKQKSSQVSIPPATALTISTVTEYQLNLLSDTPAVAPEKCEVTSPLPATPPNAPQMQISTFPHIKSSTATPVSLGKQDFIKLFSAHALRPDKDGKLFSPATFTDTRTKENFISADGICLDFDHGQPHINDILALFPGTLAAYHSTHSHAEDQPRFRVVIPLGRSVNADEHARLVKGVLSIIPDELMECLDTTCLQIARAHYLPSCPKENECHAFTGYQDGEPVNVAWLLRLGSKPEPAILPMAGTNTDTPEPVASRTFECTDSTTGEVLPLATWAAQNPLFDLVAAIGQEYLRGYLHDGKQHIVCPFEDQHTDQAEDRATFAANASPPKFAAWDVHCCHAHCDGRDRLEFIQAMLEKGWLSVDQLQATPAPAVLELKRPPYLNYRSLEIAAELVKQPLDPQEFQYHLHLMHVACTAYDGTLPDDSWTISRILGITENKWLDVKPILIRSGWQVVENGRLFNPITLREYHISQDELMKKTKGGSNGGKATQARRRERQAYLEG